MYKKITYLFFTLLSFITSFTLHAQTGCPGCQINLPPNLPADTVYLPNIPDGQVGIAYDQDISFRMPKTTTPVAALDSVTPPGLTITNIEIVSLEGVPPGLSWEPNQTVFPVATQTDGCIKICGTPTQSDTFIVMVRLKASILFFSQEATFPMVIYIAPGSSQNDGFSMLNPVGCGETEVVFSNNILSGGNSGFTYSWDFGDSTSFTGEYPPPHIYNEPGTYIVDYTAIVDTSPYILSSVIMTNLECVDLLGLGSPDVYIIVKDALTDTIIYQSASAVDNLSLPATFNIGLVLNDTGNYILEIWDEDGGLKGSDDKCGILTFNVLNNGPVVSGGFAGILNITKPITTFHYTDTVTVYPIPDAPEIAALNGVVTCITDAPLALVSNFPESNQWYLNGELITGATDSIFLANESGYYKVAFTSAQGCQSFSDSMAITIHPLPPTPLFSNNGKNFLLMFDTLNLPEEYSLQWYFNNQEIPGENGFWYCAQESGPYSLTIVDWQTGCTNEYTLNVLYNPAFDCTVGIRDLQTAIDFEVFPNPANNGFQLKIDGQLEEECTATLSDAMGRLVIKSPILGESTYFDCSSVPTGTYQLTIQTTKGQSVRLVTIMR